MFSTASRRVISGILAAAVIVGLAACAPERVPTASPSPSPSVTALPAPVDKVKSFFDKTKYSLDDPKSVWVINDKLRPLNPINYAPPDMVVAPVKHISTPLMRPAAAAAITKMFAASAAEGGGEMQIQNSYRSYSTQVNTHQYWVNQLGDKGADAQSARAGYSEHQTGWTADVASYPSKCDIQECFATTPQGKWLAANAWRFGFVIRYPKGKQAITGYIYEPWHIRYVGTYLSTEMHNTGILTLEEFFGLPPAPDYAH
ncbi:MAG: M15 family metallopeptidase [Cryobacterium sp.]|nr:M15 family metallopeptidase [Cryobacterium sp.]